MNIQWTDDLETGFARIDEQHKELLKKVDDLLTACQNGHGKEAVADTIKYLERYIKEHFRDEERVQKENAYPEYNVHKLEHEKFLKDFEELKADFEKEGASLPLVVTTNRVVVTWLMNHIKKTDKALAEYLRMYS